MFFWCVCGYLWTKARAERINLLLNSQVLEDWKQDRQMPLSPTSELHTMFCATKPKMKGKL